MPPPPECWRDTRYRLRFEGGLSFNSRKSWGYGRRRDSQTYTFQSPCFSFPTSHSFSQTVYGFLVVPDGETEASRSLCPHLLPRAPPAGGTHIWGQSNNICGAQLFPMSCGGCSLGRPLGLDGLRGEHSRSLPVERRGKNPRAATPLEPKRCWIDQTPAHTSKPQFQWPPTLKEISSYFHVYVYGSTRHSVPVWKSASNCQLSHPSLHTFFNVGQWWFNIAQ